MFNTKRILGFGALGALALIATTSFSTPSQARCTVNWVNGDCGPGTNQNNGHSSPSVESPPPAMETNPHCGYGYGGYGSMKWGNKEWSREQPSEPDAT